MHRNTLNAAARLLPTLCLAVLPSLCHAQPPLPENDTIVHSFQLATDGNFPDGLVSSSTGTLFGATYFGGANGLGAIFRVLPDGEESILYSFLNNGDGEFPQSAPALDAKGDLFGISQPGHPASSPPGIGNSILSSPGAVWELPYTGTGSTGYGSLVVLAQLTASNSGGVTLDAAGDLFGISGDGSTNGSIWEIPHTGSGTTGYGSMTTIYSFSTNGAEGYEPIGGLAINSSGSLFGTTVLGALGKGAIFELKHTSSGYSSTATVLHQFAADGSEGAFSHYRPLLAADGSLLGECTSNGSGGNGTVWQLAPDPASATGYSSTLTLIYNPANNSAGSLFQSRLIQNSAGDVFGTAESGVTADYGGVFELKHQPGGGYNYDLLYAFTGINGDGDLPLGALGFGLHGCVYGSTNSASSGYGIVFRVGPRITSVSPNFLASNPSSSQQLTISGTGLSGNDTVYWNGMPLSTSYNSASGTLTAQLPANLVTGSNGTVTVQDSLMDITTAGNIVLIGQSRLTASVQSAAIVGGSLQVILQLTNAGTGPVSGIMVTGASALHAGSSALVGNASGYGTTLAAGSSESITLNFPGYSAAGLGRLLLHISDGSGSLQQTLFFYI